MSTKNPIIIPFVKMELEGNWRTSFSNPEGAVTFDNGPKEVKTIKITLTNGNEEVYEFDPTQYIRIFRDVIHFSKK